ncbi:hypothetical protein FACS189428_2880 [Clostridia bacterium]|nr:hypothetical protein FACS189428_2880 [Clostridia bacterium]
MKNIFVTILVIAGFTACTEPIDIKTDNSAPVIVIYSTITDEFKHQEVRISRSSPYFDDEPNQGISGAQVTIQSSDNAVYHLVEHDSIQGIYYSRTPFSAKTGVTYSLSVEVDFDKDGMLDKYEATTTVLPAIVPDSLSLDPVEMFGHKNYLLYFYAQDPPGENYYLFNVIYNDSLLTAKLSNYETSDNSLFKGQYIKGQLYRFDDISNWETDSEQNREYSVYLRPGDKIETEISLISKGYFDFISQCQREQSGENPMFGGPASNIETNISNGGVGYFTGYCISRASIEFEKNNW